MATLINKSEKQVRFHWQLQIHVDSTAKWIRSKSMWATWFHFRFYGFQTSPWATKLPCRRVKRLTSDILTCCHIETERVCVCVGGGGKLRDFLVDWCSFTSPRRRRDLLYGVGPWLLTQPVTLYWHWPNQSGAGTWVGIEPMASWPGLAHSTGWAAVPWDLRGAISLMSDYNQH